MTTTECSILIVDDDYLIATELSIDLKAQGFRIIGPYARAEDARRALESNLPDCAFLDINLGEGRTSYELAAELESRGVPIAFVTGYNSLPDGETRFEDTALLMKPVEASKAAQEARRLCALSGEQG